MQREQMIRLVVRARRGDLAACDGLVRAFQDRAVALAVSILADYHLAQDAAQEAFVEAFRDIAGLRSPAAFPAWLSRIVKKRCDRITRRKYPDVIPLDSLAELDSPAPGPAQCAEARELASRVHQAIGCLPEHERLVVLLLYMGRHSYQEVAEFAGIPLSTVKSRLHSARNRLKGELLTVSEADLYAARPSRDDAFFAQIQEAIAPAVVALAAGDGARPPGPAHNPYPGGHPVADVWVRILSWALHSGTMQFDLVPHPNGIALECRQDGASVRLIDFPSSLQMALVDRFKSGAGLDLTVRDQVQQGTMPLRYRVDGGLYELSMESIPTEWGERLAMRIRRSRA